MPWVIAAAVLVAIGAALWLWQRGRGKAAPPVARRAARDRRRLVERVKDEDVADRLAEGERKRHPEADMAECYRRALRRLERDRGR